MSVKSLVSAGCLKLYSIMLRVNMLAEMFKVDTNTVLEEKCRNVHVFRVVFLGSDSILGFLFSFSKKNPKTNDTCVSL